MTLKRQLLLLGLLTLILPWIAADYVRRVDDALRQMRLAGLRELAESMGRGIAQDARLMTRLEQRDSAAPAIFVANLPGDNVFDGYLAEWPTIIFNCPLGACSMSQSHGWTSFRNLPAKVSAAVQFTVGNTSFSGANYEELRISMAVRGVSPHFFNPQKNDFDQIVLRFEDGRAYRLLASTSGKAIVERWQTGQWQRDYDTQGYWQVDHSVSSALLSTVEWQLPSSVKAQALTIEYASAELGYSVFLSETNHPFYLAHLEPEFDAAALTLLGEQQRLSVFDSHGFPVVTAGNLNLGYGLPDLERGESWLMRLYFALVNRPQIDYHLPDIPLNARDPLWLYNRVAPVARVTVPVVDIESSEGVDSKKPVGWLVLDRQEAEFDALLAQLYGQFVIVCAVFAVLVVFVLLGFASLHSWRIRRLATQSEIAVDALGNLKSVFRASRAPDEIGQLSRSFAVLLRRLSSHQDYLKNLAGKLSHELRTPIAIVQSSLDNLENEPERRDQAKYLARARGGLTRLSSTLNAMSSVNVLEQTLDQAELEVFDFGVLLKEMVAAYSDTYKERTIELKLVSETDSKALLIVRAAPDLLVNMLDKLIENANQFADLSTPIVIAVRPGVKFTHSSNRSFVKSSCYLTLSVSNVGEPLPDIVPEQLFNSMVSIRPGSAAGSSLHLGMGLYIARLICEFHGGSIHVQSTHHSRAKSAEVHFHVALPIIVDLPTNPHLSRFPK
jgi:signal transduction histidine kinase